MRFFQKRFHKKNSPSNLVFPIRPLNLQLEPIPENAKGLGKFFRDAVKDIEGVDLNYEIDTLIFVDDFLARMSKEIPMNDFAETIFTAGCYSGQVIVQNLDCTWIKQDDAGLPEGISMMPVVIKTSEGGVFDPIAKAYKRYADVNTNSLSHFYTVIAQLGQEEDNS